MTDLRVKRRERPPARLARVKQARALALTLAIAISPLAPQAARAEDTTSQTFKAGDIVVARPWARATPKGAEVGVGYFTISNRGTAPDRLVGVSADFARVEIHEMKMSGDVMTMREIKGGLPIAPGASLTFAPNGDHLMFVGLKQRLTKGESVRARLDFERAGAILVDFPVMGIGAKGPDDGVGAAHP